MPCEAQWLDQKNTTSCDFVCSTWCPPLSTLNKYWSCLAASFTRAKRTGKSFLVCLFFEKSCLLLFNRALDFPQRCCWATGLCLWGQTDATTFSVLTSANAVFCLASVIGNVSDAKATVTWNRKVLAYRLVVENCSDSSSNINFSLPFSLKYKPWIKNLVTNKKWNYIRSWSFS